MRLLAPIALIAAAVVVVVVIAGSLGGEGDDAGGARDRPAKQVQSDSESESETPEEKFYVVQAGDSFSTIAAEQGIPEDQLQQLNPDLDPQALAPGQRVKLR